MAKQKQSKTTQSKGAKQSTTTSGGSLKPRKSGVSPMDKRYQGA